MPPSYVRWVHKSTFPTWPSVTPEDGAEQRSEYLVPTKSPLMPFWLGWVAVCLATTSHVASIDTKGGVGGASSPLGRGQSPHCTRPPLVPLQQEGAGLPHFCWSGWKWLLLMSQVGIRGVSLPPRTDESLGFLPGLL